MKLSQPAESAPREVVDFAVFYDIDRCMYDTERGFALISQVTGRHTEYSKKELLASYAASKRRGESFNYVSDINRRLGEMAYQTVIEPLFVEAAQKTDLRMPGAAKIIDYTVKSGLPLGFITFGDSSGDEQSWRDAEAGQIGKIRAAAYDEYPYHVCSDIRKGDLFVKWAESGELIIPAELSQWGQPFVAKSAVLVDDKIQSFINLPKLVSGIHVVPDDPRNHIISQEGYVPQNVVSVVGLTEALGALKHIVMQRRQAR